jgi:hypothetical protein
VKMVNDEDACLCVVRGFKNRKFRYEREPLAVWSGKGFPWKMIYDKKERKAI